MAVVFVELPEQLQEYSDFIHPEFYHSKQHRATAICMAVHFPASR